MIPSRLIIRARSSLASIPAGTWWMCYAYIMGFGFQGAHFLVLARLLGPSNYGVYAAAMATASICACFAGLGAGNILVMATARSKAAFDAQLGTALVYIILTFIPLVGIALALSAGSTSTFLSALIPLLISELIFTKLFDLALESFQAHDRLQGTAHLNVLAGVVRLLGVVTFAALGATSIQGWALTYAALNALLALTGLALVFWSFERPSLEKSSLRDTWRHGIYFAVGMSSRVIDADADKVILSRSGFDTAAGYYSAAARLINLAFAPIRALIFASNTNLFRDGVDGYASVGRTIRKLLPTALAFSFFACIMIVVCSPLIPLILGDDYRESARILPLLAPILIFQSLNTLYGNALMGLGHQRTRSLAQLLMAGAGLVANLALIPRFGWPAAVAMSLATSATLAVVLALAFHLGHRRERRLLALE